MALITCPECGRMISTKADYCPQCGWKPSLLYCNEANAIPRESTQDNSIAVNDGNNTVHNLQPAETHNQHVAPTESDSTDDNLQPAESHSYNQPEVPMPSDNTDDNNEENVTISMSNGKQFKINTNALLKAAIAILAVIALIAVVRNCTRNNHKDSTSNNTSNEAITPETVTGKGWEYDINGNEVVASIKSDDNTVTVKYNEVSNPNSLVVVMNTAKVPMFKDNKLGIAFNDTKRWCEFNTDQNAGSPTYLVNIDKNILDLLKSNTNFSLIFADEEVTFSSSKALDMPSPEPIQQLPITNATPAPSTKPRTQPKPQPKPQQESAKERSEQRSQEITDQPSQTQTIDRDEEQTVDKVVDKVFADPRLIRDYTKPAIPPEEPKIKETTRPVNQLPPSVREKLIQQRGNDDEEE